MIEVKHRYSAGEFLKTMILEERGLTQKWLAAEIGCAERKYLRSVTTSAGLQLNSLLSLKKFLV